MWAQQPTRSEPYDSKGGCDHRAGFDQDCFENGGTGTRESTARVRVQSAAGVQRYDLPVLRYQSSSENRDIDYVRVHKPDGTVVFISKFRFPTAATPAWFVEDSGLLSHYRLFLRPAIT
jgi:hypothetical protein